jgi:hypothetical protein
VALARASAAWRVQHLKGAFQLPYTVRVVCTAVIWRKKHCNIRTWRKRSSHFDSMASFRYHEFEEARLGATAFTLGQKVIPLANHWSLHSDQPSGNRNWSQRQGLALIKEFIILQAKQITIPSAARTSFFVSSVDDVPGLHYCEAQQAMSSKGWCSILVDHIPDYSCRPLYSTSFTSFPASAQCRITRLFQPHLRRQ